MSVVRPEAPKGTANETIRLYTKLIPSCTLTERQLARPSFKLIQDVTKSIITQTRTLRNVFNPTDYEPNPRAWDKQRRINFVQKLIDFAADNNQPVVGCVAAKLIAGLDPVKSNELLQAIARIALARLSGNQQQRTFTKSQRQPATSSPSRDSRQLSSRGAPARSGVIKAANQNTQRKQSSEVGAEISLTNKKIREQSWGKRKVAEPTAESQPLVQNVPEATENRGHDTNGDIDCLAVSESIVIDGFNDDEMNKCIQALRIDLKQFRSLMFDMENLEKEISKTISKISNSQPS